MIESLDQIERCFGGAIPAVLSTASGDGEPNVTYISRAHRVDDERLALSNQFMSKTARNLATNPRASLLLMDPITHDEYRLALVYERTERRGPVFERLKKDIDALAALEGMQDVYRLRAADVFRVVDIAQIPPNPAGVLPTLPPARPPSPELEALAELAGCLDRAGDLDMLVDVALESLDRLFGHAHTLLLLVDEEGRRLYTVASRGFDDELVGAEVPIGHGQIGVVAERCEPIRIGNMVQSVKYSRSIRRSYEGSGISPGREIPLPGIPGVQSRIAVPAMALGQLVGVLVAETRVPAAYNAAEEQVLRIVASMLATAFEHAGDLERAADPGPPPPDSAPPAGSSPKAAVLAVRYFAVDGSVFVDGDYLIKGVAGRILWTLLGQHVATGRVDFTNKELRLDPSLELPGFKDNLESRLLLLKRRLDERSLPVRIEKTGRGRFRLDVSAPMRLDAADA